ncbi:MAG: hypothetical protein HY235_11665, partial [Acidobacteria bacterium]|nr:hypothetical protein [Acidobacteriota bacterium]
MTSEWLLLGGLFLFVLATVSAAGYFVFSRKETTTEAAEIPADITLDSPSGPGARGAVLSLLHSIGELMPASQASRQEMIQRLRHAGYRKPSAPTSYFGAKCASAFALSLGFSIAALQTRDDGSMVFAAALCGLGLGFLLPERFLDARIRSRNERLRRALPPALDLIVMSLEAGQPLDQAMMMASRGLQNLTPDLSAELAQVYLETRA